MDSIFKIFFLIICLQNIISKFNSLVHTSPEKHESVKILIMFQVIASVPDMDENDTQNAINAAHSAFQSWKNTTAKVSINLFIFINVFVNK